MILLDPSAARAVAQTLRRNTHLARLLLLLQGEVDKAADLHRPQSQIRDHNKKARMATDAAPASAAPTGATTLPSPVVVDSADFIVSVVETDKWPRRPTYLSA